MTTATSARFATLADLTAHVGKSLGTSAWLEVSQQRIGIFADATDDHQWIHVDPERAAAESPFGGPIAHGFLTLSLVVPLFGQVFSVDSLTMAVNYGLNKVRFANPVPAGGRVRLTATVDSVEQLPKGGVQMVASGQIELEGVERPAVVFEMVHRLFE